MPTSNDIFLWQVLSIWIVVNNCFKVHMIEILFPKRRFFQLSLKRNQQTKEKSFIVKRYERNKDYSWQIPKILEKRLCTYAKPLQMGYSFILSLIIIDFPLLRRTNINTYSFIFFFC